jgi:hypothetical protein
LEDQLLWRRTLLGLMRVERPWRQQLFVLSNSNSFGRIATFMFDVAGDGLRSTSARD